MRHAIMILPVALLLASGAALAQSGQGGYLGQNAGQNQPSASQDRVAPPAAHGSGQGGYLGQNPGRDVSTGPQSAPLPANHISGQGGYLGQTPSR